MQGALLVEAFLIDEGARGDDPDDLALDDPASLFRVLDLFADRHPVTGVEQASEVHIDRLHRDTRHRDRLSSLLLTTGGEGDPEEFGRALGILVEHLVEIPHAEEEDLLGMLLLGGDELLHHRGRRALCGGTTGHRTPWHNIRTIGQVEDSSAQRLDREPFR